MEEKLHSRNMIAYYFIMALESKKRRNKKDFVSVEKKVLNLTCKKKKDRKTTHHFTVTRLLGVVQARTAGGKITG